MFYSINLKAIFDYLVNFVNSGEFLACAIVAAATIAIWIIINKFVAKYREDAAEMDDPRNVHFFASIIKGALAAISITTIMQICGVNVGSLITGLGVAGIIVGFALQDFLKDLLMGASIATSHFFSVGDTIRYRSADGKTIRGKVTGYDMKITKLYNVDNGARMTIANRNLTEVEVLSDWLDIDIPTKYDLDYREARKLCEELTERFRKVEDVKDATFLGTNQFADSAIIYRIRIFVSPENDARARRDCFGIMQEVYSERSIEVPFSELIVHLQQ